MLVSFFAVGRIAFDVSLFMTALVGFATSFAGAVLGLSGFALGGAFFLAAAIMTRKCGRSQSQGRKSQ